MTCGFDSVCQVITTTAKDRRPFRKLIAEIKNKVFDFARSIVNKKELTPHDYKQRAKILVPFIQEVFPDQVRKTKDTRYLVDCTSDFGDCLRYYTTLPAFKYEYEKCTEGHAAFQVYETSIRVSADRFKRSDFAGFIRAEMNIANERGCNVDVKRECQGRTIRRLVHTGTNSNLGQYFI